MAGAIGAGQLLDIIILLAFLVIDGRAGLFMLYVDNVIWDLGFILFVDGVIDFQFFKLLIENL